MSESPTATIKTEAVDDTEKQSQATFEDVFTLLLDPIREQIRKLELSRGEDGQVQTTAALSSDDSGNQLLELQTLLTAGRESQRKLNHFVKQKADETSERLKRIESQIDEKLTGLSNKVDELAKIPEPVEEKVEVDVAGLILGKTLSESSGIESGRAELLGAIDDGNQAAQVLAGRILAARGSSAEQLATLIGEIGEALYAWRPKKSETADPFETELSQWVDQLCLQKGLPNSIGLVQIGQPFESRKHISDQRGGYVTAVRGWIVLRDNGSAVYARAKVQTG